MEKRRRAVVVNDDVTQLCMITGVLQRMGWDVHTFADAETALENVQGTPPDVIITDIQMPGIDGWRFCRMLRTGRNEKLREVPILAISAVFVSEESDRATREVGADDFLAVPFSADALMERVNSLIENQATSASRGTVVVVGFSEHEIPDLTAEFDKEGFRVIAQTQAEQVPCEVGVVNTEAETRSPDELSKLFAGSALVGVGPAGGEEKEKASSIAFDAYIRRPLQSGQLVLECEKALREHAFVKVESLLAKRTWELKEIKERYESMLSSIQDAVYIVSSDYVLEYVNDAARKRAPDSDLSGKCYRAVFGRDQRCPWCRMPEVLAGAKKHFQIHDDINDTTYSVSAAPMKHADEGISYVAIIRDITQEQILRDRLRQAEKMEAVGQLAGGVAHDFNNMLGAILGYADIVRESNLAEDRKPVDGQLNKRMETIISAAGKASSLVSQLLAFSRQGKYRNEPIAVGQMLTEVVALLQRTVNRSIRIDLEIDDTCPAVVGDPQQLQSALLNLAVNARDAMPEGGALKFTACRLRLNRDNAHVGLARGEYVKIEVSDTGCGIDTRTIEKIFDPYFTTKEAGKGTGLGLASVYGTVKNHSGSIEVTSTPGEGSTFTVLLPAGPAGDTLLVGTTPGYAALPRGQGRIMVVDDEPDICDIATSMLEKSGYDVVSMSNGAEALAHYGKSHDEINVVVLDLIMPVMGGMECFTRMKQIDPDLRAVFASGYGVGKDVQKLIDSGSCKLVPKPFTSKDLIHAVFELQSVETHSLKEAQ